MANKLIYPSINPLQMFVPDLTRDARYNSKDFDDWDFPETILPWEQLQGFCQPWQLNDTIQLQLQTNVGPVSFILKECGTDKVIDTILFTQKQQSVNEPGLFIYECTVPLAGYDPGCCYAVLEFGGTVFTLRTGELLLDTLQENTILAEYKHYEFREDIVFETGFFPSVRLPAIKTFDRPRQKATVFEDQILNMTALRAIKYRQWDLKIGLGIGIPDYFADMIGGIIGCSDFRLDGKNYTVPTDSEMEPQIIQGLAVKWWLVKLRERYTRGSKIYENDEQMDGVIVVMVNSDSKGFGNSNSGSQTAVTDVI